MGYALHKKAMDYFRQYLIIGGMPQAVQEYIDTKPGFLCTSKRI